MTESTGVVVASGHHAGHSPVGIVWTAITAIATFALAAGKDRTGKALGNPVLRTEGRVTFIDGVLAVAVLAGLVLNAAAGWWWADPLAGCVLVYYAVREARPIYYRVEGPQRRRALTAVRKGLPNDRLGSRLSTV
jgi:divalent metal cation (Fe/Co/Zn/Cd) transporter